MDKISLEESKNIKIFKRFESKYILDEDYVNDFIELLENDYFLVTDKNQILFHYHSLYFDTPKLAMWNDHENDKQIRQKIRIREYDDNSKFLEIKEKNNEQTIKTRIPVKSYNINEETNWISHNLKYDTKNLLKSLDVKYDRMTFIKKNKTERITIDFNLEYYNYHTNKIWKTTNNQVIIEIKKSYKENNEIENILNNKFDFYKQKYSKYHFGIKKTS